MRDIPPGHPLRRLFAGITEHAFLASIGVADPPLIDYVSALLSRFVHVDALHPLRGEDGRRLTDLVDMAVEADKLPADGRTRREYLRHVGDYALFWTGLFPDTLHQLRHRPCGDHVVRVTALGKRSYLLASRFDDDPFRDEAPILKRLAEQFELCAVGLREVRKEWDELAHSPLPPGAGLIG